MKKFTKGDWHVVQGAGIDELDIVTDDKASRMYHHDICSLFSYPVSQRNEMEANARLMAAAPEMYDLLYEVMYELKQYETKLTYKKTYWELIQELLAQIDGEDVTNE